MANLIDTKWLKILYKEDNTHGRKGNNFFIKKNIMNKKLFMLKLCCTHM